MPDEKDKLTLKDNAPPGGASLAERHKIGGSKLHQRVAAAAPLTQAAQQAKTLTQPSVPKANPYDTALEMPNRIGMMLDCSSSMNEGADRASLYPRGATKSKMEFLREACQDFVQNCDFSTTAIAIETFPSGNGEDEDFYRPPQEDNDPLAHLLPPSQQAPHRGKRSSQRRKGLCNVEAFLRADIDTLQGSGGTPMAPAMRASLFGNSLTRGVLVSDGEADNPAAALEIAKQWREAELQIDCVHIGRSTSGEDLLKQIAEMTGGIFIKFDSVENFAKHFKYLTPAYRGMLTSGSAGLLGAKEVK